MSPAAWALVVLIGCAPAYAGEAVDPASGLVVAPGWELVRAHCGACHAYQLVTSQRGDAEFWRGTIRWMQKTQNLWPIEPNQERAIIDYLAANYAEAEWGRRPNLAPHLMPNLIKNVL